MLSQKQLVDESINKTLEELDRQQNERLNRLILNLFEQQNEILGNIASQDMQNEFKLSLPEYTNFQSFLIENKMSNPIDVIDRRKESIEKYIGKSKPATGNSQGSNNE